MAAAKRSTKGKKASVEDVQAARDHQRLRKADNFGYDPIDRHHAASGLFARIASWTSVAAGRPATFMLAAGTIVVWAVTGPLFGFSDTWQLVINTGTTIVTFLMVFLIQNSQNRDGAAIQVKLDELIRASEAKNTFVGIEHLTDEEIDELRSKCEERAKREEPDDAPRKRANGRHSAAKA